MYKYISVVFVFSIVSCQVINRVRVIDHREYMIAVINEVVKDVEQNGWWNLPLGYQLNDYDETVLSWHLKGNVNYTNGFVASIQHLDILDSSLNQIWTSSNGVRVEMRGQLRMTDLALGFDIVSNLTDGVHLHTGVITYPLATFDFSIFRDAFTHEMTATVAGSLGRTNNQIKIMPMDQLADTLVVLFDSSIFQASVSSWGPAVFQPRAEEIIKTATVKFPGLCYDCPA